MSLKKYEKPKPNVLVLKAMYYKLFCLGEKLKIYFSSPNKQKRREKNSENCFETFVISFCQKERKPNDFKVKLFFCSGLFFLQVNHNRFKSSSIPRNHKTNTRLAMYSWCESMDFIRGQKFKWSMGHSCRESSNRFPRRCTDDRWRKLILSSMKK